MEASYTIKSYSGAELPKEYIAMVYSKWLRSYRYGNKFIKLIDSAAYYRQYHHYIHKLLNNPLAKVRLAVLTDDVDIVLGFSISRGHILDYVHVHADQRAQGIGASLVPDDICEVTHMTKIGEVIWKNKYDGWRFNPFV